MIPKHSVISADFSVVFIVFVLFLMLVCENQVFLCFRRLGWKNFVDCFIEDRLKQRSFFHLGTIPLMLNGLTLSLGCAGA